jgi:hypothetical protein
MLKPRLHNCLRPTVDLREKWDNRGQLADDRPQAAKRKGRLNTFPPVTENMKAAEIPIELVGRAELAKRLLKTERTIYNWTRLGKIPHLKVGRSTLYSWYHVLKAIRNNSN